MNMAAGLEQVMVRISDSAAPHCPHCAYDLSGMIASWAHACPLHARCTECGKDIDLPPVLNPAAFVPPWSFEHARSLSPRAFVQTSWRCFAPGNFWRELLPSHPVNFRRLALFAAIWLFLLHMVVAAIAFVAMRLNPTWEVGVSGPLQADLPLIAYTTWPYRLVLVPIGPQTWGHASGLPVVAMTFWPLLLMPLLVAVFAHRMHAEIKPRPKLLIRAIVTMFPAALLAYLLLFMGVIVLVLVPDLPTDRYDTVIFAGFLFALLAFPAWLAHSWKHNLKHSLRVRRPDRAALAMGVVAGLSGLGLMVWLLAVGV